MAKSIEFPMVDAEGWETVIDIPTVNAVCPTCEGEGQHSRHLGVVEPDDFDTEGMEDYLAGKYDKTCEGCKGKRVIPVMDAEWLTAHPDVLEAVKQRNLEEALYRAECEMERRYGA